MLQIPGLGPKTVKQIYEELGIETVEELRLAAEAGTLQSLKGLSAKTESADPRRHHRARDRGRRDCCSTGRRRQSRASPPRSKSAPGVRLITPAGSFRRRRETIGDLDLLAETDDPAALMEFFTGLGAVDEVVNRGGHKAAVRLLRGPQVDLMAMPPGEAGTYLIHFTGSKEHNVKLRAIARDRGWSLSEKGFLRIGEDGEPLTGDAAELRTFATEEEAYGFLDLPFIEPEIREDHGEIEAARAGRLPRLVTQSDLRGDCHTHSEWSDGAHTIETMAEACRRRGYAYEVLTDHSFSLAIARGLAPERVEQQRTIIAELNARFEREEHEGTAPPETPPEGFRLLHGCELEVRADGTLDYEDDLLASFDVVVASVHVSRRQPRAELTRRTLNAINSPHVDIIAHPSGRMIQTRDDLDLDWDAVYAAAAATGTALEINGSPHRLDLAAERARRAVEEGCVLTIDSDAHSTSRARLRPLGGHPGPSRVGRTGFGAQHPLPRRAPRVGRRVGGSSQGLTDYHRRGESLRCPRGFGRPARPRPPRRRHRRPGAPARRSPQLGRGGAAPGGDAGRVAPDSRPARHARTEHGVPIESLILPAVAAIGCLGAIGLVPIGALMVPALAATAFLVDRTLVLEERILVGQHGV